MNYAPKGNTREKRMRGHCTMGGRQSDVLVVIVVGVRSSPMWSVWSTYSSCRPVDLSSPASSRLAEAKYTTMGTRLLLWFIKMFPPLPSPSSSPTTLVTIALAALALFFTIVAVARPPPSSPLPLPFLPPSLLLPSSSATHFCCSSSPAVVLVSTARLQHSRQ